MATKELRAKISADGKQFISEVGKAEKSVKGLGDAGKVGMMSLAKSIGIAGGAVEIISKGFQSLKKIISDMVKDAADRLMDLVSSAKETYAQLSSASGRSASGLSADAEMVSQLRKIQKDGGLVGGASAEKAAKLIKELNEKYDANLSVSADSSGGQYVDGLDGLEQKVLQRQDKQRLEYLEEQKKNLDEQVRLQKQLVDKTMGLAYVNLHGWGDNKAAQKELGELTEKQLELTQKISDARRADTWLDRRVEMQKEEKEIAEKEYEKEQERREEEARAEEKAMQEAEKAAKQKDEEDKKRRDAKLKAIDDERKARIDAVAAVSEAEERRRQSRQSMEEMLDERAHERRMERIESERRSIEAKLGAFGFSLNGLDPFETYGQAQKRVERQRLDESIARKLQQRRETGDSQTWTTAERERLKEYMRLERKEGKLSGIEERSRERQEAKQWQEKIASAQKAVADSEREVAKALWALRSGVYVVR